ncbi:MAG: DUF1631 domain-containing protein, partial [Pseudomonadales bacterium]|nr:DUF1631 domain-containing protein [Pseudomonadales bacterium]
MQLDNKKLFTEITSTVVEQTEELYTNCFETVNEQLFLLAENADNNKIQSEIFDSMREIRSNRQQLEDNFKKAIQSSAKAFSMDPKIGQKPLDIVAPAKADGELSLVNFKDLDDKIAFSAIIQKANDLYFHALFEFNQRLSILNHGYKIDEYSNPFGPARLTQIFSDTTANLELAQSYKNLLLKQFGSCVLEELEEPYKQCNQLLIKAGVLPHLKYDVKKRSGAGASTGATPAAESDIPAETASGAEHTSSAVEGSVPQAESPPQLYQSIQEILSSRSSADTSWRTPNHSDTGATGSTPNAPAQPASGQPVQATVSTFGSGAPTAFAQDPAGTAAPQPAAPAVQYYQNHQLVNAINSIQHQQKQLPEQLVYDPTLIEETRKQLVQQLTNSGDPSKPHEIEGLDADTIDLIGMLFEFMLNDQDLCPSVKALLSHLHTPFLKVALLDKDFFTQHNHPARLLLNAMAKAGARWVDENDKERGIFPKMRSIVDRVLLEFEINIELFSELTDDFNHYINQMEKRAEIAEKRASESIKGKEKLRIARDKAIQEINLRSNKSSIPDFVDQFLRQCWLDILVFTLLRKDEKHPLWTEQIDLIEQLIWSTTPRSSEKEQEQVQKKIPDINEIISRGFEQLGGYPGNSKALLRKISAHQEELLSKPVRSKAASEKETTDTSTPTTGSTRQTTESTVPKEPAKKPTEKKFSPELLAAIKQLRQIPFGTWFEFTTNAQGDKIKGKLSWYSPATS